MQGVSLVAADCRVVQLPGYVPRNVVDSEPDNLVRDSSGNGREPKRDLRVKGRGGFAFRPHRLQVQHVPSGWHSVALDLAALQVCQQPALSMIPVLGFIGPLPQMLGPM